MNYVEKKNNASDSNWTFLPLPLLHTHTHTHSDIPVKFSPYLEIFDFWEDFTCFNVQCFIWVIDELLLVLMYCFNVKHFYQFNNELISIPINNSPHWAATTTSPWKSLPPWLSSTSARQLSATRGSHPSSLQKCLTTSSTPSFREQALPNLWCHGFSPWWLLSC